MSIAYLEKFADTHISESELHGVSSEAARSCAEWRIEVSSVANKVDSGVEEARSAVLVSPSDLDGVVETKGESHE